MNRALTILVVMLVAVGFNYAQEQSNTLPQKRTTALRIATNIKLDGKLDEAIWQEAVVATNFIENDPAPGETPSQASEVRVLYDNQAIYIGATLYDAHPDSILQELSERDNMGNTDWFGVIIDAYQDGQNGLGFFVTPAGVQLDTKYSALGGGNNGPGIIFSGDRNWDAVWGSEARITADGWVIEMKIPYMALRFPDKQMQEWNINFGRQVRRNREQSFWNPVDPQEQGFVRQSGTMTGIRDIKAPIRLSATPFIAVYAENYRDKTSNPSSTWGRSFNGGMDIKYGINDALTLDMTLIPDFGESISDNQVLNLSPFEVRFDENRQFFTEGTELFNKGGLFYSRRVGGTPMHYWAVEGGDLLEEGEEIISNPQTTQLINATKVSGRLENGLGIGFFNAVAGQTSALVKSPEGAEREIQTSPLTNYNVFVLDQNLKNNSFITLVNTNVLRAGADYDANTTGTIFNLKNKKNSYGIFGSGAVSQKYYPDRADLGYRYGIGFGKISGRFNFEVYTNMESYDYDPNDLGFLRSPNERNIGFNFNYNVYEPFWKDRFNAGGFGFWTGYSRLHKPDVFTDYGLNAWAWARTKNFTNFNVWTYGEPFQTYDYFEPRTADFSRYFAYPRSFNIGAWISSDYRKKFALDINGNFRPFEADGRYRLNFGLAPRYRFSNKFSVRLSTDIYNWKNDAGFVDNWGDDIIFGVRDVFTVENFINANYTFNNKMSLNFRLRHYWSRAEYDSFHLLQEDGHLGTTDYNSFNDNSFNAFTIDCIYRWRFAPGSDIFIIWKNGIFGYDNLEESIIYNYNDSVNRLWDTPQSNSLSIKVIYFLDYLAVTGGNKNADKLDAGDDRDGWRMRGGRRR